MSDQELKPCPFCQEHLEWRTDLCGFVHQDESFCVASGLLIDKTEVDRWNTRATDPLMDQLKAELNRLYTKIDEDRFAALADDNVPRLVFNAAIEAIANKDMLLKQMTEALEGALSIINNSSGVSGYHLNGDIATWGEFEEVEQIKQALQSYRNRKKTDADE